MADIYRYTMTHYTGTQYDTLLPKSAYTTTATLPASGWSSSTKSQTITVAVVSADDDVLVTYAPESHDAYVNAGVYCSAQADGSLTFKCNKIPTANLTVNIILL